MICKQCGAEVSDTQRFCNKCGARIQRMEETVQETSIAENYIKQKVEQPEMPPIDTAAQTVQAEVHVPKAVSQEEKYTQSNRPDTTAEEEAKVISEEARYQEVDLASEAIHKESESTTPNRKNKAIAGLLAIFLGQLGIQWFYWGKKKWGLIHLVVFLVLAVAIQPLLTIYQIVCLVEGAVFILLDPSKLPAFFE